MTAESCIDCGVDTLPTRWDSRAEYYMVHDHVWGAAGMTLLSGVLCIGCLEDRIGRQLTAADFEPDVPINDLTIADNDKAWSWRTARLTARLSTPPPPQPSHLDAAELRGNYLEHLQTHRGHSFANEQQDAYNRFLAALPRCDCGEALLAPISVQRGYCEACRYRIIAADRHHRRVKAKKELAAKRREKQPI